MDPMAYFFLLIPIPTVFLYLWLSSRNELEVIRTDLAAKTSEIASKKTQITEFEQKLAPILSIEKEAAKLRAETNELRSTTETIRTTYAEKHELLKRLESEVAVYDERLAFAELGLYEPHFDFSDSETFKTNIREVRSQQKAMISAKNATICPTDWEVDGSRSKGQTMINRQKRLTLRAFNNECEAAIANARWNNIVAMEKRVRNAANAIDKANASMNLSISSGYIDLKLKELQLTHEYRERLKIEKDERAESSRTAREEKKLLAEAKAAEKEEQKYQTLLDAAKKEAGTNNSNTELLRRIKELETALSEAHATGERARSMAEMTKSGYVYVISNIGSFGEDVVKIGMTRRVDPDDRVRELGDASVPFRFDTHAMIYSDDAPKLELELHKEFSDRRINAANMRKEFFSVKLDEIEQAVGQLAPDADFFRDREAQEWHETLARRKEALHLDKTAASQRYPAAI